MLESLRLENFRGFEDHTVPLRKLTVMVGANNAGKSTVVEALRLVALVSERVRTGSAGFARVPDWLEHPHAFAGVAPAIRGKPTEGHERNLFHRYGDPPGVLTGTFESGAVITTFVGPEAQLHGVIRLANGAPLTRRSGALQLDQIAVQPQVAPLLRDEAIRQDVTIRRGEGTYLAPQHFRNQLWRSAAAFQEFSGLAERTWPGLQIKELSGDADHPEEPLRLSIRDHDFVGEVSLMGHGLQMWLQLMWFLARTPREAIVVLDEPDVFMHPDLQRRLLILVRSRFRQLLIATHSVEIVSDVDASAVLGIDRRRTSSTFATSLPKLQGVLDDLGAVQNVQVARLLRARSFYLVEGEDVGLLRILQRTVAPDANPIDLIPHAELGGRGGWGSGVPGRLPTKNASGEKIRSYCLLDRDYYPDDEVAEREREARDWNIQLRVWSKKEIENFLLIPGAISRFIESQTGSHVSGPTPAQVAEKIDEIVETLKEEPVYHSLVQTLEHRDRKGGVTRAMKQARAWLDEQWLDQSRRWSVVPGKTVLARLATWSQSDFGVGFGAEAIARQLIRDEIAPEVADAIQAIPAGRPLKR